MTSARFALMAVSIAALLAAASASGGSVVFGSPLSVQQTQAVFTRAQIPIQDPVIPVWEYPYELGIAFYASFRYEGDPHLVTYRPPTVVLGSTSTIGGYAVLYAVYVYPTNADARYDERSVAQLVDRINSIEAKLSKEDVTPTIREPIRVGNVVFVGLHNLGSVAARRVQNALNELEAVSGLKRFVWPAPPRRVGERVVRFHVGETKTFDESQLPAHTVVVCRGSAFVVPSWSTWDAHVTYGRFEDSGDIHFGYESLQHGKRLRVSCAHRGRG